MLILIASCAMPFTGIAQDDFDDFIKRHNTSFGNFVKERNAEYEAFRKKVNEEYAAMLEQAWKEYNAFTKISVPEDKVKPVPPVVFPMDDKTPVPKPLPYKDVVTVPKPEPQPEPIAPIEESPKPVTPVVPKVSFSFFGTLADVRFETSMKNNLTVINEHSISKAWKDMSTDNYTNLVYDCLQIRKERHLCDWAYLEMLHCMSEKLQGKGTNSATLLMAYVYCQSGYKMRLARGGNGKLYMLYASKHIIYDKSYYDVDGTKFYIYGDAPKQIYICDISFPKEKAMSLYIPDELLLAYKASPVKTRCSARNSDVRTTMTTNLNLMDFYATYPTSMIGDNFVSRWAMYANTPMSERVKQQIYPSLRTAIKGCSQLVAVNKLLNYVQIGFEYEYDDKVWGHDRAFFSEESLYYPYCDCEDRSILFTRLVRDLLGLKCILIYYPGHLAAAVEFTEADVVGDYILLNNRKFVVSDPTYINAPVGRTMPGMDNKIAKVILL